MIKISKCCETMRCVLFLPTYISLKQEGKTSGLFNPFQSQCHNDSLSPHADKLSQCLDTFVCATVEYCVDSLSPPIRNHRMNEVVTAQKESQSKLNAFLYFPLDESEKAIPQRMNHHFIIKRLKCRLFSFCYQLIIFDLF